MKDGTAADQLIPLLTERVSIQPPASDDHLDQELRRLTQPTPLAPSEPASGKHLTDALELPEHLASPSGSPANATGADVPAGLPVSPAVAALREALLQDLMARLPLDVEALVSAKLEPIMANLIARLAAEVRLSLAEALRDLLDDAVRQEYAAGPAASPTFAPDQNA